MRYNRPRRNKFKSNDRGFRRNDSQDMRTGAFNSDSKSFQRRSFSGNGFRPEKLLEKYNNLAKEASSNGDKILSESYYQYADHFLRVIENRNMVENNSKLNLGDSSTKEKSEDKIILKDSKDKITLKDKEDPPPLQTQNTEEI